MIFYQILSTNSLSKCMEISFENLSVDIGSLKAQHSSFHSPFCKLQILIFSFDLWPACSCLGYKLSNKNLVCNFHLVNESYWARSIQPKFLDISVQNSMDRFGPTGKVSKKRVHLLRWTNFPGRTGWNFG